MPGVLAARHRFTGRNLDNRQHAHIVAGGRAAAAGRSKPS